MSCERKSRRIWAPHLAALLVGASVWMLVPASARADSPSVIGFGAHATGPETELVSGQIDPGGESTEYVVGYATVNSDWCKSRPSERPRQADVQLVGGEPALSPPFVVGWGPPHHSTEPQTLPFTDGESHPVSVELEGLTPGAEYCAQLVAFNDSGYAADGKLLFVAGAPSVINPKFVAASNSLQAEVNPAGQATSYQLLYAPIASEWCVTFGSKGTPAKLGALTPLSFTDGSYHPVAVNLMGLVAGAEYCAALYAENESGTGLSFQVAFTEMPTVESVTPAAGPVGGGSTVTIKGENLGEASAVHFGAAAASIQADAPNTIVVTTPAHEAANVDVTVTTPAGTSAPSEADRFAYEKAPVSCPELAGPAGSCGPGGGPGPTNPPGPGPTLGETEVVGVTEGTVTVHTPGSKTFTVFHGGRIPDGSEIDATHGKVIITVVTPDGKTVSAEVFGGRFRVHQDKNGETHFILTLPLTGCARTKLPPGSAAAVSAASRRHKPKSRYLWVSEKGGHWGTNGRYVSTSVEGTRWLTLDECNRSVVKVTEGRVKVRDLVNRRTKTLGAGGRFAAYARHHKPHRHH